MSEDPIVQEVRRIREEHAARFDDDLKAIFADLKGTEEARDQQQSPLLSLLSRGKKCPILRCTGRPTRYGAPSAADGAWGASTSSP